MHLQSGNLFQPSAAACVSDWCLTMLLSNLLTPYAVNAAQIVERIRTMPGAPRGRGRGFGPPFAPGRGWTGARIPGRPDSVRDAPRDRPPPEPRARPRVAAWGLANGSGGAPQWKPPPEAEDPNQQPLGARLGSGPHTPREAPAPAPVSCPVAAQLCVVALCMRAIKGLDQVCPTCRHRLRPLRQHLLSGHVSCRWSWSAAPKGRLSSNRCGRTQGLLLYCLDLFDSLTCGTQRTTPERGAAAGCRAGSRAGG